MPYELGQEVFERFSRRNELTKQSVDRAPPQWSPAQPQFLLTPQFPLSPLFAGCLLPPQSTETALSPVVPQKQDLEGKVLQARQVTLRLEFKELQFLTASR